MFDLGQCVSRIHTCGHHFSCDLGNLESNQRARIQRGFRLFPYQEVWTWCPEFCPMPSVKLMRLVLRALLCARADMCVAIALKSRYI